MTEEIEIKGYCDPKFEQIKEPFADNFKKRLEVSASFAAIIDGKTVCNIWAGYDSGEKDRPWEMDTIVNVFSTSKVMVALCALILIDRGKMELDDPIANHWPEFAQNEKKKIPIRQIFAHTSGVSAFAESLLNHDFAFFDK